MNARHLTSLLSCLAMAARAAALGCAEPPCPASAVSACCCACCAGACCCSSCTCCWSAAASGCSCSSCCSSAPADRGRERATDAGSAAPAASVASVPSGSLEFEGSPSWRRAERSRESLGASRVSACTSTYLQRQSRRRRSVGGCLCGSCLRVSVVAVQRQAPATTATPTCCGTGLRPQPKAQQQVHGSPLRLRCCISRLWFRR